MQKKLLTELLRKKQTVFSFKELLLTWRKVDAKILKSRLNYYVKRGDLHHIRRGLYAKDANYNRLELATKIFAPSYVSFETVLSQAGITFQYHKQIFVASYQSRDIECDGQTYIFKAIKPTILTNSLGVEIQKNYSIASTERAFLDTVYLNTEYHFDNLAPLNWEKVSELLPIYGDNKSMKARVDKYRAAFAKSIARPSRRDVYKGKKQ